jgi:hypothetical protein
MGLGILGLGLEDGFYTFSDGVFFFFSILLLTCGPAF